MILNEKRALWSNNTYLCPAGYDFIIKVSQSVIERSSYLQSWPIARKDVRLLPWYEISNCFLTKILHKLKSKKKKKNMTRPKREPSQPMQFNVVCDFLCCLKSVDTLTFNVGRWLSCLCWFCSIREIMRIAFVNSMSSLNDTSIDLGCKHSSEGINYRDLLRKLIATDALYTTEGFELSHPFGGDFNELQKVHLYRRTGLQYLRCMYHVCVICFKPKARCALNRHNQ